MIAGLGWISVTGPGTAIVRVTTPVGKQIVLMFFIAFDFALVLGPLEIFYDFVPKSI